MIQYVDLVPVCEFALVRKRVQSLAERAVNEHGRLARTEDLGMQSGHKVSIRCGRGRDNVGLRAVQCPALSGTIYKFPSWRENCLEAACLMGDRSLSQPDSWSHN
jgi:hypothetical protein